MTDQGPQEPPRGRRARGSVDPGPEYPGDRPRRAYPPSQYPEIVPGQRRRAAPGDSQAAQDYPGPPGNRGRLAGDASSGHGRAAPPGESAAGYGPRTPAGASSPGYGRPRHLPTMGVPGRPGRQPAATTGRAHPGSRHLAGPAARVRRRAGTDVPVHQATGPAATHDPPPQAKDPVTPGPPRRPQHPVRSPAGRVIFMPTAVPGVVRGPRPTRHPIVAGDAAVTLRCRPVGRDRRVVRCRPVGRAWTAT